MIKYNKTIAAALLALTIFGINISDVRADSQTTELTMSMESTYTLIVPARTAIVYGTENSAIGSVAVTGNLADDKVVRVTAAKNDFTSGSNSFAFNLLSEGKSFTSADWSQKDITEKKTCELTVNIPEATWDTVKPGDYTGGIVFGTELNTTE